ncbi:MAG: M48 family metalloprotease [Sedimentisphaerales bacterium]|nr:M48 family metalloprotease [Sedimentisphaerales bacterium]
MNQLVIFLNDSGRAFRDYAGAMLVQTGALMAALALVDLLIRKRVRASVRYWLWMLVFVKLVLPPTLALPTGVGYWLDVETPAVTPVAEEPLPVVTPPVSPPRAVSPLPREPMEVLPASQVSPEAIAPTAAAPALTWQAVVFALWLVGLVVFGLLLVQRAFFVRGLIAQSDTADDDLMETLERCARQIGVDRGIGLRVSPNTFSPAVCGLVRPTILIPASLLVRLSGESLRAVLIHELAHIKRGDLWVNLGQTLLQVVYFYNPLVWVAHAIVRRVREQAVDEMVLVALGAEAKSYSKTLIDIAEMAFFRANLALRLIGVAESKKSLEGRIKHMLTRPIPKRARIGFAGIAAILMTAAALLPMARGQNSERRNDASVARLPGGVTVELLGVCSWPVGGRRCWRPDGTKLSDEIYAAKSNTHPGPGDYGFMVKVTGPEDLDIRWRTIEGSTGWEGSCQVEDAQGSVLENGTAAISDMEAGRTSTSIRIGVATGAWGTISTHDGGSMRIGRGTGVLWSQAFADSDRIHIIASTQWRKDRAERIVAVDLEGTVHSGWCGSVASGNVDQFTARFRDLKLSQIKEFQFQVRPYEWAEFRGVSLRPGTRTNVQVIAGLTDEAEYAHAVVEEGVGFDGLVVGDPNCTAELIKSKLGEPERETKSRETGWWLSYKGSYGLDFWLRLDTNMLAEIRLNRGFKGPLRSGISMASTKTDVFHVYGPPLKEETVLDLTKHFGDQILYTRAGLRGRSENSKIFYGQNGLLFWFEGEQILQIVIHPKQPQERENAGGLGSGQAVDVEWRTASGTRLAELGKALMIWANDHDDTFPDSLEDLRSEVDQDTLQWLREHVQYVGKGMKATDYPGEVLAYDKTMMADGNGTNVLYLDAHVAFEDSQRLEQIGMALASEPSEAELVESATRLSDLGKALLFYANEHDDRLPDSLMGVKEYSGVGFAWLYSNVAYLGKGVTVANNPERPVAYDKTLIESGTGTNVLHLNTAVTFEHPDRLAELGIRRDVQSPLAGRVESARRFANLGKALLVYAVDHGTFPDSLDQMTSYLRPEDLAWLKANTEYAGQGKTERMPPDTVMAYDKTLLEGNLGTNVLYLDCHVAFETPEQLERVGLISRKSAMQRLRFLGLAAIMYAHEHDSTLADDLGSLRPYTGDEARFAWMRDNFVYLGKGAKLEVRDPADKPLAYWRTGPVDSDGTAVVFFDGHVEFVSPERLAQFGLSSIPFESASVANSHEGVWITFLPRSPIRSLAEYHHAIQVSPVPAPPGYRSVPFPACDLEIRRAADQQRVARIYFPESGWTPSGLTPEMRRRIGELPDGEYLLAFCYGNARCSNAARLRLDSQYDPSAEPTLSLVPLPVPPGGSPMLLGIRAVRPSPIDPELTNQAVAFPSLVVDGTERRLTQMVWVGPVGPLRPGQQEVRILRLSEYEPTIEPGRAHSAKARVGKYESALVQIPAADDLARQWDEATKNLAPYEPPSAVLQGKVVGTDGLAGRGYEVCLFGDKGERIVEVAAEDGSYDFANIPSGPYQLICNPKGRGQPCVTINSVTVTAGQSRVLNVSLEGRYRLAGTVVREDGSAVARMDVTLTCEDPDAQAEFQDFVLTDEQGRFELGSPYSQVTYVGVNGRRIRGSMPQLSTVPTGLDITLRDDGRGAAL